MELLSIAKQALLPPARFTPASLEQSFLDEYAERFARNRRAAMVIALFAWILYGGWDVLHALRSEAFEPVIHYIFIIRGLGAVILATVVFRAFDDIFLTERRATFVLAGGIGGIFTLLLIMIVISPFPVNYLFYFTGLTLILLFMFGLSRLRVRPMLWLMLYCAIASAIMLPNASRMEARHLLPGAVAMLGDLQDLSTYYFWLAVTYLLSFMFLGYVIAVELERTTRDDFRRERELSATNRQSERSHQALQLAYQDLEESKQAMEDRTEALIAMKEELRDRAEENNRNKSKFLADAAHDLRQPMQALSSFLEASSIALQNGETGRAAELLTYAQKATRLTRSSFNAILDISRLESGFVVAELADVDVNEVLREAVALFDDLAAQGQVTLRARYSQSGSGFVRTDRHLLNRVLRNLISNGIKYRAPRPEVGSAVVVGVVQLRNRVRIDVVDNGIGIAASKWAEIFKPFVQVGNASRDREMGLGLGLSIVNAIIPLLPDHRLDMRSAEGKGTRFSLELPIADAPVLSAEEEVVTERSGPIDLSDVYALLVEDDVLVRKGAEALFTSCGMPHESAGTRSELIARIESMERPPDIVVTDYRLPDELTGREVVERVREMFGADIPVIVMTGEVAELEADAWLGAGKILRKPVSPRRLVEHINALALR